MERSSWVGARVKGKRGFAGRERVRDMAGFQPGVGHQGQSQNGNLISVWGLVRLTCLKGSQTCVQKAEVHGHVPGERSGRARPDTCPWSSAADFIGPFWSPVRELPALGLLRGEGVGMMSQKRGCELPCKLTGTYPMSRARLTCITGSFLLPKGDLRASSLLG